MIKPPRSVLYVDRGNSDIIRIAAFSEYAENEMVFGFFGLDSSEDPIYAYEYSDKIVRKEEMFPIRTNYTDAKAKNNILVDHFTIHKEGKGYLNGGFHLRMKHRSRPSHSVVLPPPVNSTSSKFLDFFILTDLLSQYSPSPEKPTNLDIVINAAPDTLLVQRVRFSGADFPLEESIAEEQARIGINTVLIARLRGKTLKGGLTGEVILPKPQDLIKRHKGTYVVMSLPNDQTTFVIKTFVFN